MRHTEAIRIALLAYLAGITFSFLALPLIAESQHINIDADRFGLLAQNIAQGNGFVYEQGGPGVLERAPFYAFVVAGIFKLSGGFSLAAVQIFQAVIHAVTSFLVYLIGLHLSGKRTARLAQVGFAIHPIALWYTARIWVETTHTLLLTVVALSFLLLLESPSTKRSLGLGIAIGFSCLTKSILLLFPFIVILILSFRFAASGTRTGIIVLVTALVTILPWTLRNYQMSRHFVPVNTSLGFNLINGNIIGEHWLDRDYRIFDYWNMASQRTDSLLKGHAVRWESAEGDRVLIQHALQKYAQAPLTFMWHVAANCFTFWYLSESNLKSAFMGVLQVSLLMLATVSFFRMREDERRKHMAIVVLLLYYILVNVSILGLGRYSAPMIPFLLLLAAPFIERVFDRRRT